MLPKSGPRHGPWWMKGKRGKNMLGTRSDESGFMRLQKVETKLYKVLYIMSLITVVAKLHILNFISKTYSLRFTTVS